MRRGPHHKGLRIHTIRNCSSCSRCWPRPAHPPGRSTPPDPSASWCRTSPAARARPRAITYGSTRSSRRCRRSAPGSCAPSPSRAASARRRSPRCRRCRRAASRGSTTHNGRAFSPRRHAGGLCRADPGRPAELRQADQGGEHSGTVVPRESVTLKRTPARKGNAAFLHFLS